MKQSETFVFTLGVYDNFHIGHLNLFRRASRLADKLIVGIVDDPAVKKQKGKDRPIHPIKDRVEIVDALSMVDKVYVVEDFDPNLLISQCMHKRYPGDAVYVLGEDQTHLKPVGEGWIKKGLLVVTIPRTPGVSTSKIIKKMEEK